MNSSHTWVAEAPSNIALIKYMGKTDADNNLPANASISYTLDHLITRVELEPTTARFDSWEMLAAKGFEPIQLSADGQKKFLNHLKNIKDMFLYEGNFVVRSANNFPADCGVASSASSFAALTQAAASALQDLTAERGKGRRALNASELARVSRRGSGSSCRSFFSGWVEWRKDEVMAVDLPQKDLWHILAIVDAGKKSVSSSQAHRRVTSSLMFSGRPRRAEGRLESFVQSLRSDAWEAAYQIGWAEFWDMHALFLTSQPHFGYLAPGSLKALDVGQKQWAERGNGPLITMDAGANVHFLFRKEDRGLAFDLLAELKQYGRVITNLETT
jgi:diphosphomevalonate decarboxylase